MTEATFVCPTCASPVAPTERQCASCGAMVSGVSPALTVGASGVATPAPVVAPGPNSPWSAVMARLSELLFGDFEILGELGEGGMAAVFLAHEFALNRKVALKVMSPALMMGEGMVDRFHQEAVTQANLQHAHIVGVHGTRTVEDLHFFIMQFIAGRTLQQVLHAELAAGRLLAIPVVQAILFQAGSALAYAHRRGVIHRDIKPGNIMLNGDGDAVVTDFGIAKVAEAPSQTATGMVIGTPTYMSPEQCFALDLTGASDQYSLGVVAYELLTGRPPFEGTSFVLMSAHTNSPPPPIHTLRPDCPPEVEAAVMRMLAKDRDHRFPDLGEALHAMGAQAPGARADDPLRRELQRLADARNVEAKLADLLRTPHTPAPRSKPSAPTAGRDRTVPSPPASARPLSATQVMSGESAPTAGDDALAARPVRTTVEMPGESRREAQPGGSRTGLLIGGGIAVAAAAAFGVWLMTRAPSTIAPTAATTATTSGTDARAAGAPEPPTAPPDDSGETSAPSASSATPDATPAATDAGPAAPAARLRIEGPTTLPINERRRLTARLVTADGSGAPAERVSWSSSNRAVATVDARSGELVARSAGTTTVTGRSEGGSSTLVVTVPPEAIVAAAPAITGSPAASPTLPRPRPAIDSVAGAAPASVVSPPPAAPTAPATAPERSDAELLSDAQQTIASYAQALSSRDPARIRRVYPSISSDELGRWQAMYDATEQVRVAMSGVEALGKLSPAAGATARFHVTQTVTFTVAGTRKSQTQKSELTATLRREGTGWVVAGIGDR